MKMVKIIILILCVISLVSITGLCEEEIKIIELTADNYEEELIESEVPVVVYFWAIWCRPCKQMSPIIERLAKFHKNKVKFVKVNVDKSKRKFLNQFRPLRGLPLLVFYKKGKEVDRTLGFLPFTTINNKLIFLLKEEKKDKKNDDDCKGGVCPVPEGWEDD